MGSSWFIEPLDRAHSREGFDCGEADLNEYLQRYARQNHESGVARTFVALESAENAKILGFYSLAAGSISKDNLPPGLARRYPNFPLPILRIARLAVSREVQRRGLGEHLLLDALHRCLLVSEEVGLIAVLIDAKNQNAKNFYGRYEFDSLPDQELALWLPLPALQRLFQES